jgi:asparagine synthetase B (glutamine-hydrolysing)
MCGIAGVYLRDPKAKADLDGMLDTLLDEIEHRGGDATGFVALGDEGVTEWQKAACDARDFGKHRRRVPKGTRTILAHTRWATQGLPAFIENNHPLKRGSFYVIHNGHINNDHKLFELAGRTRYGQVDSEAIPARFASFGKLGAAPKVMTEIEGAAAIAVVDEAHPDELVLARGYSSPLFVLQTKRYVLWGSTQATVKEAYEKHVGRLPKRQKIEQVKQGTVLHFKDGKLTRKSFKPYSPPKVTRLPNITLPWKDVTPQPVSSSWSWEREEDVLDCDACGTAISWKEMEYRWDDEDKTTYQLCADCDVLWDMDGVPKISREADIVYESFDEVNAAILADDDSE